MPRNNRRSADWHDLADRDLQVVIPFLPESEADFEAYAADLYLEHTIDGEISFDIGVTGAEALGALMDQVFIQNTPPENPSQGALWFDTSPMTIQALTKFARTGGNT